MEEVERSSEGTLPKEVRSSEGAVRQVSGDLPRERRPALRKETLQLKEFKKACKDKDAPKRPAGGVYGQLTQDHRRDGERWKSLPVDERQKMDVMGISCTNSSTVNTTMM